MTVLAYLTFLVYGWDIMEPVTFFITSLTALASYMYFLYFNAEHTYEDVDDHIVETALEKELRSVSVDLKSVLDSVKMIKELDLAVPDDDEEFEVITQCKSEK
ncbi:hypothetical protein AGDE_03786 [Angomonas deanei]|nr:hypothetical protein AGDE_03786 [Angomonas deanei]|eukprot:EPY40142.1 hypothetical protein AGDE_03786 [Angomonas deanei]